MMALGVRDKIANKLRHLVADPLMPGTKRARVVAVASSKGGVGKTTTSINLGAAFAEQGLRVLVIDLDPQAHVAAALGEYPNAYLSDVLLGRMRDVCEVTFASRYDNLDLAGSDKTLSETEMILSTKIGKELILEGALEVARTLYDVILIDCPPNIGTLTLNGLCAADHLLIPSDMSVLALEGVGDILHAVETVRKRLGRTIKIAGVLLTRVDKRATRINTTMENSFGEHYRNLILRTRIPQSTEVNRAHVVQKSVLHYARSSSGAVAYRALAEELAPRIQLTHVAQHVAAHA